MKEDKRTKNNIIYNTVGNLLFLASSWIITLLVVKLYGFKDAGILALSASFANSLYALSSFGMRGYQASDINYRFNNDTYVKSRLLTCFVGYILFGVFVLLNNYPSYTKLCILMYLLYKSVEAFDDIYYGAIQREWSMKEIGISYAIHGISSLAGFILGATLFKSLLISIIFMFIFSLAITFIYDRKSYLKHYTYKEKTDTLRNLLIVCLPLVIYVFLYNNIQFYPRYYLEKVSGSEILGYYSSIAAPVLLLQAVASYLFSPLINLFTTYVKENKKKEYKHLINKSYILLFVLGILGLIYIITLGDFSLKLLFGSEILKYSSLLYTTLVVALLLSMLTFNNMILTITRKFKSLILENSMCIIFSIILSHIFIDKYKIYGINIVLIISLFLGIILTINSVYNYEKKECTFMKKIKQFIIRFAIKHRKVIAKIFPSSIIFKVEAIVNKNFNDFERTSKLDKNLENGINMVGHIKGQYGLGQGARSLVHSLKTTKVKFSAIDVNNGTVDKHNDTEFDSIITKDFKYNINVFHVQPYTSFEIGLSQIEGITNLKGRYNIGYL